VSLRPTGIVPALIMALELAAASVVVRLGWELGGRIWMLLH
jgi:hypothetical protein